jgi:chromosome segregation ATPase
MGFKTTVGNNYAITQFQNSVKDNVEKEMSLYGYARQFMNNHEKHLSVSQFKLKTENEKLLKKKDELNAEKDLLSLNVRQKQAKNAELDEQARRIRTAQRQLKELQAELETKEKALAKREAELAQREKLLQDSNAVLKYREKALNKRERALRANEYVDKNIQTPQTQRPDRALPSFCE